MKAIFTQQKGSEKVNAPKWILYTGLLIFIAGLVYINLFAYDMAIDETQPINKIMRSLPKGMVLFLAVLFQPIIEEAGFRGWQSGRRYFKIISLLIILLFTYGTYPHILPVSGIALLFTYLILSKPTYAKKIITILATSLLFGLIHIPNYSRIDLQIPTVISLSGFSLIAHYLTWRYHLIAAIVLHILNNAFALWGTMNTATSFKEGNNEVSISYPTFTLGNDELAINSDSLFFEGDAKIFVSKYIQKFLNPSGFSIFNDDIGKIVTIRAALTRDTTDDAGLLAAIISNLQLTIDTTAVPLYTLHYPPTDTLRIRESEGGPLKLTINADVLKQLISGRYGITFDTDDRDQHTIVQLSSHTILLKEKADFIRLLQENHITLTADSSRMTTLLTIRDTNP
ncbi:MAG: hypothetical protein BGO09_14995 [Bacteroidetes bacterium 47-18]|nr:MAG: hypothetical protein BGO09_14995 [Bacteroidetes bacterium 47-18]